VQDVKTVKPQDADRWIFFLLRNRYTKERAWQWMEDNWDWVEKTYGSDKSYDYWPRYAAAVANSKELQARYRKFFEPKMDNPVLSRNIAIGMEEIGNRLAWLERDIKSVQEFFKAQ
jgi:aminopeptidase N